jgi:hypothetical protein
VLHTTNLLPCVLLHQRLTVSETCCRGHATSGELGYGPGGKKSSAQPDKVPALEGANTHMVRSRLRRLRASLFWAQARLDSCP